MAENVFLDGKSEYILEALSTIQAFYFNDRVIIAENAQ